MSNVGYLAYQQVHASEMANRLDRALAEWDREAMTLQSRQQLALSLEPLVDVLDPLAADAIDPVGALEVPIGVVEALRDREFAGHTYAFALAELVDRLPQGTTELDEQDRSLLAEVAATAATVAAASYRRMVGW